MSPALRVALAACLALAACSSSSSSSPTTTGDASVGSNRPLGASCDPTVATPCTPVPGACSASVCDRKSLLCIVVESDAAGCGSSTNICTDDSECNGGTCVEGLCYQSCLTPSDCDGGTCTRICPNDAGPTSTCKAYCTTSIGGPDRDQ
jgi:hypothetical protein